MFTLSNILLTILWLFILASLIIGFSMVIEEGLIIPWQLCNWEDDILQKILYWYLFLCEMLIIIPPIICALILCLGITRAATNPEEFTKPEPIIIEKNEEKPKTKSICNWVGLAKNIIEEQEKGGYRYTGTSTGIICEEQLNFVLIE